MQFEAFSTPLPSSNQLSSFSFRQCSSSELFLVLLSLAPSLTSVSSSWIESSDQPLDEASLQQLRDAFNLFNQAPSHMLFYNYETVSLCLQSLRACSTPIPLIESFIRRLYVDAQRDAHSTLTLLCSLQSFTCCVSQRVGSLVCSHGSCGDVFAASSVSLDMNALFFSLFSAIHSSVPSSFPSNPNETSFTIMDAHCRCLASLLDHSLLVLSSLLHDRSVDSPPSLQHHVMHDTVIQEGWVARNLSSLREFLWRILSQPLLMSRHHASVSQLLAACVRIDMLSETDDVASNLLQMTGFQPIFAAVEEWDGSPAGSQTVCGILGMLGDACKHLAFHRQITPLALLALRLFKWLLGDGLRSDLALAPLAQLAQLAQRLHGQPLWALLPECVVAGMVTALLGVSEETRRRVLRGMFGVAAVAQWLAQVACYVIPVYINQLEGKSILLLCKGIDSRGSAFVTLSGLFQGSQCIYNVLVYLLKHMAQENMKAWEFLFFLRSPFEDSSLETGEVAIPTCSSVSVRQMVRQQGHRVLWPLLFDCTDASPHERAMSETALRSLFELLSLFVET